MLNQRALRCALLFAAALAGQQPPADNVIRVQTRLVQVNVVVHARQGAVEDLKQSDFTLLDRGKPQQISFFSMEKASTVRKGPPLPPNIFSNRYKSGTATPSAVTVILLDGLNTRREDQMFARQQLLKFLRTLTPDDRIALYTLGSSLKVIQDFTNDPERIRRAVDKYRGTSTGDLAASEPEPAQTGIAELDEFLNSSSGVEADFAQTNRTLGTYKALEAIAAHVAHLPGRKNLIWISGGFPLTLNMDDPSTFGDPRRDQRSFSEERERTVRALNNANLAMYPVDARGLVGVPASMTAQSAARPGRAGSPPPSMTPKGLDTMLELADATGGRAFINNNDIAKAIRSALDDSEVTYTLGFYPSSESLDGRFHELKVHIDRKGVNVRHRKGYFATPETPEDDKQREFALRTALASPLESNEIALSARIDPTDKPQPGSYLLRVVLDINQLNIVPKDDKFVGNVDVIFLQQSNEGSSLDSVKDTIAMNMSEPTYKSYREKGMILAKAIVPKPNLATLRVLVRDQGSGAIGTLLIPIRQLR